MTKNHCGTCAVPMKKEVTRIDCAGLRAGVIDGRGNCSTWTAAGRTATIGEALAYASTAGIHVTRPTMIHWCVAHGIGKQVPRTPWGRWMVDVARLKKLLRED